MKKSTEEHRQVPEQLHAPQVGRAPYAVCATLLTLIKEDPDAVLAEAESKDGSTNWRIYWIEGDVLGLVQATAEVEGWSMDTQEEVNPDISVTMLRLPAISEVQVDVTQARLDQWGSGHQVTGTLIVKTGNNEVRIPQQPSSTTKPDQVEEFHTALLKAWRG